MSTKDPINAKESASESAPPTAETKIEVKKELAATAPMLVETNAHASAKPSEDLEKLRREQYELRDRLNNLRENDIFALKEKISRLNLYVAVVGAVIGILSFLGIRNYVDIEKTIQTRIAEQTKASVDFNEKYLRAVTFVQGRDYNNAIPLFRELYNQRPEDEVLFYALLDSLNQANRYEEAMPVIDLARSKGFLLQGYKNSLSLNNAGYFLLIKSADDPKLKDEAYSLLRRAEASASGNEELSHPIFNLTMFHALYGTREQAKQYAQRFRSLQNPDWQWVIPENEFWFKRLQQAQPKIAEELKTAFAK